MHLRLLRLPEVSVAVYHHRATGLTVGLVMPIEGAADTSHRASLQTHGGTQAPRQYCSRPLPMTRPLVFPLWSQALLASVASQVGFPQDHICPDHDWSTAVITVDLVNGAVLIFLFLNESEGHHLVQSFPTLASNFMVRFLKVSALSFIILARISSAC